MASVVTVDGAAVVCFDVMAAGSCVTGAFVLFVSADAVGFVVWADAFGAEDEVVGGFGEFAMFGFIAGVASEFDLVVSIVGCFDGEARTGQISKHAAKLRATMEIMFLICVCIPSRNRPSCCSETASLHRAPRANRRPQPDLESCTSFRAEHHRARQKSFCRRCSR